MKNEIIDYLQCKDENAINDLFNKALKTKREHLGNKVYLRGLIEYTNICYKSCYYCGLRKENNIERYNLYDAEVIDAAEFAYKNNFGSIVIQSGEVRNKIFDKQITNLLQKINEKTDNKLGITLSLGEQDTKTLRKWKEEGNAIRYLLRIETSNPALYNKIHPSNSLHSFDKRLKTLNTLKELNYQVGTGTMIGLPFQTLEDIADDIIFFKENDIDMVGLGPYIEHSATPLYIHKDELLPLKDRLELTLKTIAIIRLLIPDVNIASATALQVIDPQGREKGILAGANVVMPNITPTKYRSNYLLYENKVCLDDTADQCMNCIFNRILSTGSEIGFNEQGNSLHFSKKRK
ncbi:MAG: [FeFe] hydrogenase H-cluster radical SAM maturase HydE [Bacteroidetes bacterium]|nr:[FeFe] hydrogenase H-cluster radical SAM maturase HydE [Bacteroidota bacterium]